MRQPVNIALLRFVCSQEGDAGPGFCDLVHCGSSFCPMGESPCRIETSVIPFLIKVHFGPAAREAAPDDNLGMCLRYEQIPCVE